MSTRGLTPADAEYNFLMQAKDMDFYGIELFRAQVPRTVCMVTVIRWSY